MKAGITWTSAVHGVHCEGFDVDKALGEEGLDRLAKLQELSGEGSALTFDASLRSSV